MKTHRMVYTTLFTILALSMISLPGASLPASAAQGTRHADIEAPVLTELRMNGQADFIVWMAEKADLTPACSLRTKEEKGRFVFEALRATAERTQAPLRAYLDGLSVRYQAFYIANKIWVQDGTEALLNEIAARPDVARLTANHTFQLQDPVERYVGPKTEAIEPNISFINADGVWGLGIDGSGTVMAGNDTGLDETHPAIAPHYRGCLDPPACTTWDHNYSWWDAWGDFPNDPYDDYGHGTHTTGTMVGDDDGENQIGVAPGAKTIHCKNMQFGGGDDAHFIECFEWDLAPWDLNGQNPNPGMAPDAVNNSWGYWGGNNPAFEDEIAALQAAGIAVEVSAGNEGPSCYSLRSPGDYSEVLTTGSVNHSGGVLPGTLTDFSSRGPSYLYPDDLAIPDIMAPGENVRSAVPYGGYEYWSGTSMAGPHATALVGLIWSANPALRGQIDLTYQIIRDTAVPLTGQGGSGCGGDYGDGPNNDWGHGTIDAYGAVLMAIGMGGAGTLEGTVTDAGTGQPIDDAIIVAVHDEGYTYKATTNEFGFYQRMVAAGTFAITACHEQYQCQTVADVVVEEDGITVQDFGLEPRGRLFGYVTDYDNGTPIEGALVQSDYAAWTTTNASGFYELWLDPGIHLIEASAENYAPETATVEIFSGVDTQQDFVLQAAVVFIPSPLHATLPMGGSDSMDATLLNRLPWAYDFEFLELRPGFRPVKAGVSTLPSGEPQTGDTSRAPDGYRPSAVEPQSAGGWMLDGTVAIFKDADPWGGTDVELFLAANGIPYEVHTSAEFGSLDFADYSMIIFSGDQPQWFYDAYALYVTKFEEYVEGGGFLNFFSCDAGWNGGSLMAPLPGGTTWTGWMYEEYNVIDDPLHPVVQGVPNPFWGSFASHGHFANLPPDGHIIAHEQLGGLPTIVEYPLGAGWLIAFGQPLEISHNWGWDAGLIMENTLLWGYQYIPAGDVPWFATDPISGTVPAEGSIDVTASFLATPDAGVTQPGHYYLTLKVKGDPSVNVPVTMTVEAPLDWGKLAGTVTGLGHCDADPAALEEAEVLVQGSSGATWTLETDENGYYQLWVDEAESPLTVSVTYPDHEGDEATGVIIVGGQITVVNFDLRWLVPCLNVEPLALEATIGLGETTVQQLTLTNDGAAEASFELTEIDQGFVPTRRGFLPASDGSFPRGPDAPSVERAPNVPSGAPSGAGLMTGAPALAVDIYPGYNLVTFESETPGTWSIVAPLPGNTYFAGDFINGDFGTLYVIDYDTNSLHSVDTATGESTLIGSSTPYGGESWTGMTGSVDGTMYASSTNISRSTLYTVDLDTGAVTVVGEITNAPAIIDIAITPDGEMYGVDIVNDNLVQIDPASGAGTVIGYAGYDANYAQGMDYEEESGTLYLAAFNNGTYQGELRIADPATGNSVLVGAFPGGAEVDSLGWATGGGGDVPWLYEEPISGTVPVDGGQVIVEVTFDAGMVAQPGDYLADLKVRSDDPVNRSINVDVTMHVTAPPDWGKLTGAVTGLGYCDSDPAPLEGALVEVVGGLTVETDENGLYVVWLEEGSYDINVTAGEHTGASAPVSIVAGGVTTQDFDLRWLKPCLSVVPESMAVSLALGSTTVEPLTLTNDGAAMATFEIGERNRGFVPAAGPPLPGAALVPEGQAFTPQGASSPQAIVQPCEARIDEVSILHIYTAETTNSIQRALNELGYAYDSLYAEDWTWIDFGPYDVVVVGMDGGWITQPSIQKIRTDVIDAGKRAIFVGGTCVYEFAVGVNDYLVLNDINNYCWDTSNPPHWTLVDAGHGLADGLPGSYDFIDVSATFYQARVTDPDIEPIAVNGDGYTNFLYKSDGFPAAEGSITQGGDLIWFINSAYSWYWGSQPDFDLLKQLISNSITYAGGGVPWLAEDPASGTVDPDGGTVDVDVTFDAGAVAQPGEYLATLNVYSDDPVKSRASVPVTMTVSAPPDWGKLTGTVRGLGHCDADPAPLEDAAVVVSNGGTMTVTTDAEGVYVIWREEGTYNVTALADDHTSSSDEVTITGGMTTTLDLDLRSIQPCMSLTPDSMEVVLALGDSDTLPLTLINTGAGPSEFHIRETTQTLGIEMGPPTSSGEVCRVEDKDPAVQVGGTPAGPLGSGGPDPFGYTYMDSNEPGGPVYEWIEIAPPEGGEGIPLYLSGIDDGYYWPIDLPFPFNFYGIDRSQLAVGTNGGIYFQDGYFGYWNGAIPGDPGFGFTDFVAHFWDDLYVTPGEVYYLIDGDRIIIEYYQVSGCCVSPEHATWQVIMFENGSMLFQYQDVTLGDWRDYGADATIGIQGDAYTGLQYSYNTPSLAPELAICFAYPGTSPNCAPSGVRWLSEDPVEGIVPPDSTFDVQVTFTALPTMTYGTYPATLIIRTDDAANPQVAVPVSMTIVEPGATMHVGGMEGYFSQDYMGRPVLRIHVLALDHDGNPLSDVLVDASIWVPSGGPFMRSRYTKPSGNARFHWGSRTSGTWTLCVDDMTRAGWVYDPNQNIVTCMDWYH